MGWITPAIQSLHVAILIRLTAIFIYYVIKTVPSDAKSREEQDGSKQKFLGEMTAKLWPDLYQGVTKNTKDK